MEYPVKEAVVDRSGLRHHLHCQALDLLNNPGVCASYFTTAEKIFGLEVRKSAAVVVTLWRMNEITLL